MLGIRIISDANIMDDTVKNALSRYFSDPTALLPSACCSSCKKDSSQSIRRTIIAAPEYLRIQIGLLQQVSKEKKDKYGNVKVDKKTGNPIMVVNVVKNTNPISIPDTIDLTAHMDIPATIQNPYPVQ